MVSVVALLLLFVGAFGYQGWVLYRRRLLESRSWEDLIASLRKIDINPLLEITENYLHPGANQLRIEPWAMWKAVGGITGVGRLWENADVMLDLARFAERWNDANGRVISEMMRRDATRVRKALFRVQMGFLLQRGMVRSPFQLQEAISSYCLMRGRLLGMYQDSHVGRLQVLSQAL